MMMHGKYDKAIVAAVIAVLIVIEQLTGWKGAAVAEWITVVLAVASPIAVWLVPNRSG